MFDHVTIRVADRDASERFYETVLAALGVDTTYSTHKYAEWHDFSLTRADAAHPLSRGLHVGFVAPSRAQVDAFWQAGVDAGYASDGEPGPRPQYLPDYYGGFLRDPDGHSVEAVHYAGVRRHGIVDHLWLRVSDLPAAVAFYTTVADSVDLGLRATEPDSQTFYGPKDGGSLTVVADGEPRSENIHIAFPGDEAAVVRFHADALAAGYRDNGIPGERPQYHPGYYAAYVLDPDGNNIEVVDHHRD